MAKLLYENGKFFKKSKGKLIEVNKDGTPIFRTNSRLVSSTVVRKRKRQINLVDEVVGTTLNAATTKEGMGTIGGAAVGGWVGSSVGIAAAGTAVAGTLPIAAAGGLIGYLAVKAFGKKKK